MTDLASTHVFPREGSTTNRIPRVPPSSPGRSGCRASGRRLGLGSTWIRVAGILMSLFMYGCASASSRYAESELTHVVLAPSGEGLVGADADLATARLAEFSDRQRAVLTTALQRADTIIADTTYTNVIGHLERSGIVEWTPRKSALLPQHIGMTYGSYMRGRFATEGNYQLSDIKARYKNSKTTGWTTACPWDREDCRLETYLNTKFMTPDRPMHAYVNTLIHERLHSFGMEHGDSQKRADNLCDAAYVYGDVAEALLRYRMGGTAIVPRERLCRGVHDYLVELGIVKQN